MKNKEKILELRKLSKSYNEISEILKISKATVCYHCKSMGINDSINGIKKFPNEKISELNEYYKNNTIDDTAKYFNISRSTVIKYVDSKREKLCDDEKKKRNYLKVKTRRQKLKQMGVEYLGGKCCKCGYNDCIWALEFHHTNSNEKDFSISKYSNLSWNRIKKELNKCILVCSNCHKEIHFNEHWDVSPLSDKQLKG